jgi:hypothetical protein
MDAYARWDKTRELREALDAFEEHAAEARSEFPGVEWYWDWIRWEERLADLKRKAGVVDRTPENG